MRKEVKNAVDFITNILGNRLNQNRLETFSQRLHNLLISHYQNHWFPDRPNKGSGYRCIRINHKMDPLIAQAGADIGLCESELFELLPSELTLWVDPADVSYRIGEDGSIGNLYDTPSETEESLSSSSSETSSAYSSDDDSTGFHQHHHHHPAMSMDFLQACKDQLRYYLPETSEMSNHPMNFEQYLTTFVAS